MKGLKKLLEEKKCFKLICGAGNENLDEVEKLVALYAKAGCHFFDLSASEEVLKAAQKGLDLVISKAEQKDYHFCLSIGTEGDPHMQKAKIDNNKCKSCGKCVEACPQSAINKYFKVKEGCIGCLKCKYVCNHNAIEIYSIVNLLNLSTFRPFNLACIEFHASQTDEKEVDETWDYLNSNFEGILSLCLGRAKLSNEKVLSRVKRLVDKREPYTTIIQADGSPMAGGEDNFKTTLQAVAMAEIIQEEKLSGDLPAYILVSGGTNSKTAELARICGVDINGIAIGSYARKIVKNYIIREDFLKNDAIFNEALKIAQNLVKSAQVI